MVVVGGGAAGLSGALMLARSRRSVLVIDAGAPRNAPAEGVHGLLGRDGIPPAELLARGRAEVSGVRRPGRRRGEVDRGRPGRRRVHRDAWPTAGRVRGAPAAGDHRPGRRAARRPGAARAVGPRRAALPVLPRLGGPRPGRSACWPPGRWSVHQALLFRQLSADVTLFSHRTPAPDRGAGRAARRARDPGRRRRGGRAGGRRRPAHRRAAGATARWSRREAVVVAPRMVARAGLPRVGLGLRAVEHPSGVGEHVPADPTGRTEVPGVWVAGNVTDLTAQVGTAAAAAASAAAQINADLVTEETRPRSPRTGTRSRRRPRRGWPSWHRLLRWVWTRWEWKARRCTVRSGRAASRRYPLGCRPARFGRRS